MEKQETQKHKGFVMELSQKFRDDGYQINAIDGITENDPRIVENENGVGDGENKIPDIDAYDEKVERVIRGEAKIGDGDIWIRKRMVRVRDRVLSLPDRPF